MINIPLRGTEQHLFLLDFFVSYKNASIKYNIIIFEDFVEISVQSWEPITIKHFSIYFVKRRISITSWMPSLAFYTDDFYVETDTEQKLGFPPGVAEKLVLNTMYKWKNYSSTLQKITLFNDGTNSNGTSDQLVLTQSEKCTFVPSVAQEIEINSSNESNNIEPSSTQSFKMDHVSDSYNGAVRENYVWTQTLSDLDILVKVPQHIKTSKDTIKINISSNGIKIDGKPSASLADLEWSNIFNGKLNFKIRSSESTWSISGKQINIHLEKATERWWEALIVDEPKIDLNKIDCSKHFNDMTPEEQMKVQELMWNHQQKILGKPTSEQIKMEATLRQVWNTKGSPFQGTPYDSSILKYN